MSRTNSPAGLAAATGSERNTRISQALQVLVGIQAKLVVEAVAAQMPAASIFWDIADRQVEIIGDDFEVIVRCRQSPNAQGSGTPGGPR